MYYKLTLIPTKIGTGDPNNPYKCSGKLKTIGWGHWNGLIIE